MRAGVYADDNEAKRFLLGKVTLTEGRREERYIMPQLHVAIVFFHLIVDCSTCVWIGNDEERGLIIFNVDILEGFFNGVPVLVHRTYFSSEYHPHPLTSHPQNNPRFIFLRVFHYTVISLGEELTDKIIVQPDLRSLIGLGRSGQSSWEASISHVS